MYAVKLRATGETRDLLETLEQAQESVKDWEEYDRDHNKYTPGRYEIKEVHPITLTINITLDPETAYITDMDITQGIYNRLSVAEQGITKPLSVNEAIRTIEDEITNYL